MKMKTQIKIENLTKTFRTVNGKLTALNDVSLEIFEGECVVFGGENGSGKSVLMSIIAGLETCDSGTVTVNSGTKPSAGLVFQEAETQILGETPAEDIAFGPKNQGLKKEQIEQAVKKALEETGLTQKADFPARFLSGGEKRRLAVACMLAMNLPIIILDEPFANLDYNGVKQVNALIRKLKSDGKTQWLPLRLAGARVRAVWRARRGAEPVSGVRGGGGARRTAKRRRTAAG